MSFLDIAVITIGERGGIGLFLEDCPGRGSEESYGHTPCIGGVLWSYSQFCGLLVCYSSLWNDAVFLLLKRFPFLRASCGCGLVVWVCECFCRKL